MFENMEQEGDIIVPEDILKEADAVTFNILPAKSKARYYLKELEKFRDWMKSKNVFVVKEEVILAYFNGLIQKYAPPSLWYTYSMLKSTLFVFKKVDISKFKMLIAVLKNKSKGYQPKKAKTFDQKDVEMFINVAADETFLFLKVVTIMGVMGACRCDELVNLKTTDIEDKGNLLVVKILKTKNYKSRSFVVTSSGEGKDTLNGLEIYRKYAALRPSALGEGRFFLCYRLGKCTAQPVGINTLAKIPSLIANYLNLKDPHLYTGHCFRRTSAMFLANASADILTLTRHGGWRSSSVAESYVEDSLTNKIDIARKITNPEENTGKKIRIQVKATEGTMEATEDQFSVTGISGTFGLKNPTFNNCTVNFHVNK